jgi:hypothetical protein
MEAEVQVILEAATEVLKPQEVLDLALPLQVQSYWVVKDLQPQVSMHRVVVVVTLEAVEELDGVAMEAVEVLRI